MHCGGPSRHRESQGYHRDTVVGVQNGALNSIQTPKRCSKAQDVFSFE